MAFIYFLKLQYTWRIYDFNIFKFNVTSHHEFKANHHNGQLPVGLLAQLVKHCTGIAEVMDSNSILAWICFRPKFYYYILSSVHYCKDCFHTLLKTTVHIYHFHIFKFIFKKYWTENEFQTSSKLCAFLLTVHFLSTCQVLEEFLNQTTEKKLAMLKKISQFYIIVIWSDITISAP